MNSNSVRYSLSGIVRPIVFAAGCLALSALGVAPALAQRPSTDQHVRELARYLDGVEIAEPIVYRRLAVYPILVKDVPLLRGPWLTADQAIGRGVLLINEKNGGSVPTLTAENRSQNEYVFMMTGEVIVGGRQTRTVRHDAVLAPGQKIDLDVFCVEAHRWAGEEHFSAGSKNMVPQSIQGKLRGGADQSKVWSEVERNNTALSAQNSTASLDAALNSAPVRSKLDEVERRIVPAIPQGTVGFIFVAGGQALGAELFGSEDIARATLPKLLGSYAVDYVILNGPNYESLASGDQRTAIDFFETLCRTGSQRASSPGSGSGISTRAGSLLGDGVSLDGVLAHYGVQIGDKSAPNPGPKSPVIIYPLPAQREYNNHR